MSTLPHNQKRKTALIHSGHVSLKDGQIALDNLNKIDCYIIIRAVNNCITICEAVE